MRKDHALSRALCCLGWTAALAGYAVAPAAGAATLRDLTSVQFVGNAPYGVQQRAAAAVGVRNVRLAVRWSDVERTPGKLDWTASDAKVLPILKGGGRPIITIFGSNPQYPPLTAGPKGNPAARSVALVAFGRFAADVAKHYGAATPAGAPIIYEIWNEPNTKTFWGGAPDPETYAAIAGSACNAIKAANGRAVVVGLAMEGTPVKSPYFVMAYGIDIYRQWAKRAYTPTLAKCLDGVSMHPYRPKPETYLSDEEALTSFVRLSWKKGQPPLIVNSEWGYSSFDKGAPAGETLQAALDLRALLIGAGAGRLTNLYTVTDTSRTVNDKDNRYGLTDYDGRKKLSGQAVGIVLSRIGDYTIDGLSTLKSRPDVFVFRCHAAGGSKRAIVIWSASGRANDSVALDTVGHGWTRVSLPDGAESRADGAALSVSNMPTLLVSN